MNSILQCVFSTPFLLGYFQTEQYKVDLNKKSPMKGQLAIVFADLMASMQSALTEKVLAPSLFKKQIEKWAPQFAGYRQQDSHEFLRFMLDGLHEDLNRVSLTKKPKYSFKDDDIDALPKEQQAILSWNRYQSFNSSIIFDLFGGMLQSTVTCLKCNYQSITFEMFLDLSLPIPKVKL